MSLGPQKRARNGPVITSPLRARYNGLTGPFGPINITGPSIFTRVVHRELDWGTSVAYNEIACLSSVFSWEVGAEWLCQCTRRLDWRGSLVSQRMAGDICTAYNGALLLSSVFRRADGAQRLLCERSVASLAIVLGNHCGWNGPITEQWWEPTVISCPQALHHPAASSCCIHKLSLQGLSWYLETGCPNRGFIDFCVSKVWYKIHTTNKIDPIPLQILLF